VDCRIHFLTHSTFHLRSSVPSIDVILSVQYCDKVLIACWPILASWGRFACTKIVPVLEIYFCSLGIWQDCGRICYSFVSVRFLRAAQIPSSRDFGFEQFRDKVLSACWPILVSWGRFACTKNFPFLEIFVFVR